VLQIRGGATDAIDIDWRFFLAGGLCAAASHGITTPIDVVKTKMQTNPEKYTKGVISAAKDIIANEGVGVLLAGLG
jgi:solute carrier family 25 (mitochondrial phosphate transporter), member 3